MVDRPDLPGTGSTARRGGVQRMRKTGRRAVPWPMVSTGLELLLLGAVLLLFALLGWATPLRRDFDPGGLALLALAGALLLGTGAVVRRREA